MQSFEFCILISANKIQNIIKIHTELFKIDLKHATIIKVSLKVLKSIIGLGE